MACAVQKANSKEKLKQLWYIWFVILPFFFFNPDRMVSCLYCVPRCRKLNYEQQFSSSDELIRFLILKDRARQTP